jgi:hypothetical protein
MTGRKTFGVIAIIIAMMTVIGFQSQAKAEGNKNYLVRGSWSMQFRISNNFTLSNFEGGLISAKRHLSEKSAIRFGLSLSGSTSDRSTDVISITEDSLRRRARDESRDDDLDAFSAGITSQIMFYTTSDKALNFYFGVGPDFNYTRSKRNSVIQNDQDHIPVRDGTDSAFGRQWSFGLLGSWGVEWFITRKLSIMAEYGAGMEYFSRHEESKSITYIEDRTATSQKINDEDGFRFYSANVNFGLSVYFN